MLPRCLLLAALVGIATTARADSPRLADDSIIASNLRLLETWIESELLYQNQPGVVIGIVHDQELLYARGFGYADVATKRPMTIDTAFRIGSQSKTFTAVAVMQLQEQGHLALTDPVEKHLPDFKVTRGKVSSERITVGQLLTHTAGLQSEGTGTVHWTDLQFPTPQQVDESSRSLNALFAPTSKRNYSNLGFNLAGRIVEKVSGESFEQYVAKHILAPLRMTDTCVGLPEAFRQRLATGYGRRMPDGTRAVIPCWDAKGMTPAAGMSSTVVDLAKYASWQLRLHGSDSREVLKASTLRQMQRTQWVDPDWKGGWGLGFHVSHKPERDLVGHYGQVPGFFSTTYIDPKQKFGVVVLTNSMDSQPYLGQPRSIPERVFNWIGPAVERALKKERVDATPREWERLVGKYRTMWSDFQVLVLEGKLVAFDPNDADPKATAATLEPVGASGSVFRIASGPDVQSVGEELSFELDADAVVGCVISGAKIPRVR